MKSHKIIINLYLIIIVTAGVLFSQEVLEDDPQVGLRGVIREGRQQIRLALPEFDTSRDNTQLRAINNRIREILVNDLQNSGIFRFIPEERYTWIQHYVGEIPNFDGWASIEAETLITGSLDVEENRLVFEGKIYDISSKQMRTGRRYRGTYNQEDTIAHTFANEIVRQFTGKAGFFTTQIVFISDRTGTKELYISDYDGRNLTQITNLKSIALFPFMSPDKNDIYFTSYHSGFPKIYKVSSLGNSRLTAVDGSSNGDITPAVSPDGKKLAFSSPRSGDSEIYVKDLKSGKLDRITYHYGIDTSPAWSPNGKSLVFTSDRSGMPNLYITDEKGLEPTRLTYELNYSDHGDWSPDGERIVFAGRLRGFFNIFVKDLRTNELFQLTLNSRNNEDPCWSSDGRKIVFCSDRSGKYQLYTMNADGTDQKMLTSTGNNTDPRWSK